MFIAAVFKTAKNLKATKMSSIGEWINKLWDSQAMEYSSAVKKIGHQPMKRPGGNVNTYCYCCYSDAKSCQTVL